MEICQREMKRVPRIPRHFDLSKFEEQANSEELKTPWETELQTMRLVRYV